MKVFAFALALAGVTTAASLSAQNVPRPGTVNTSRRNTDCSYNRTTNTVGDIIFGRTNLNTNCRDVNSRDNGAWYQVGNGRSPIYERRVIDRNGNVIIQRARRNSNGTFTILNSRVANSNDKEWRKFEKQQEKLRRRQEKRGDRDFNRDGDDDDDRDRDARKGDSNFRFDQFGNRINIGPAARGDRDDSFKSERKDHGRGKGEKDRD